MKTKHLQTTIAVLLALVALGGCSQDENLPANSPHEVSLFTKTGGDTGSAPITGSYRIYAFNDQSECVINEAFVPGSSKLSFEQDGMYVLITLGNINTSALDIPMGKDKDLQSATIDYKEGQAIPMLYYANKPGFASSTHSYTAQLEPAVGAIRLEITGHKELFTYALKNMYPSIRLSHVLEPDGGTGTPTASLPLANGETVNCFPTDGNITISYSLDGETGELATGIPYKAGKVVTLYFTIDNNEVTLTSSGISGWEDGQDPIEDDVVMEPTPPVVITTAEELKAALTGTDSATPIVVNGDLTLDFGGGVTNMGADHTLSIAPGATLTLSDGLIVCQNADATINYTLTINGGGTLLIDEAERSSKDNIRWGTLLLENITLKLEGTGKISSSNIRVGNGATIVVNSQTSWSIYVEYSNSLTVERGGRIDINNFVGEGIYSMGELLIDGGEVSINGQGASAIRVGYHSANTGKLILRNGGKLTSVADGAVYLYGDLGSGYGCKVTGASGLFRTDTYTLSTNDEVAVGDNETTTALRSGVYRWDATNGIFVWAAQ